jgi:hypothetical protein
MKKILQALDTASSKPVEGSNDMKKFLSVVTEGTNPHKVALPVQMAMNHYQKPAEQVAPSLLKKYFVEASEEAALRVSEEQTKRRNLINQYAQTIAERVRLKDDVTDESLRTENPCWKGYKPVGTEKKSGKTVPNCVPKK